jgi:predicted Zn-dependent peptidase
MASRNGQKLTMAGGASIPQPPELAAPRLPAVRRKWVDVGNFEVAVTKAGEVPCFEMRLRFSGGAARDPFGGATSRLLSAAFLSGTGRTDAESLSRALQRIGASLAISIKQDTTVVSMEGLSSEFDAALSILREVLFMPAYPEDELETARRRVLQSLAIARSEPSRIATDATRRAMFGRHPYGRTTPDPSMATRPSRRHILALHKRLVSAEGPIFVVVSDLSSSKVISSIEKTFAVAFPRYAGGAHQAGGERSPSSPRRVSRAERANAGGGQRPVGARPSAFSLSPPTFKGRGRAVLVDRPGAVQSTIRVGLIGPRRTDPSYDATLLANTVLGGYFSSRLVENVREDKGYAYGIGSRITHRQLVSTITVATDVGTDVTAAALLEILYEMERLALAAPKDREIEAAKRYLVGSTRLSLDTYGGLASSLDALFADGLDEKFLATIKARLDKVGPQDVAEAAARWFDPALATVVVVGDASKIASSVERLLRRPVRVVKAPEEI